MGKLCNGCPMFKFNAKLHSNVCDSKTGCIFVPKLENKKIELPFLCKNCLNQVNCPSILEDKSKCIWRRTK